MQIPPGGSLFLGTSNSVGDGASTHTLAQTLVPKVFPSLLPVSAKGLNKLFPLR